MYTTLNQFWALRFTPKNIFIKDDFFFFLIFKKYSTEIPQCSTAFGKRQRLIFEIILRRIIIANGFCWTFCELCIFFFFFWLQCLKQLFSPRKLMASPRDFGANIRCIDDVFFLFRSRREYLSVTVSNLDWFVCTAHLYRGRAH